MQPASRQSRFTKSSQVTVGESPRRPVRTMGDLLQENRELLTNVEELTTELAVS